MKKYIKASSKELRKKAKVMEQYLPEKKKFTSNGEKVKCSAVKYKLLSDQNEPVSKINIERRSNMVQSIVKQ